MRVLRDIRFDAACRRAAAAIGVCLAALLLCGVLRDRGDLPRGAEILTAAVGDVLACTVITLYASTFAYAASNAISEKACSFREFVLISENYFCASCVAAEIAKLIFLLLPCSGAELVGGVVLIADAAVSWIVPLKVMENRRAAFLAGAIQSPAAFAPR